ncbi:MAG: beta-lactamase family protein [Verrucomicrobia bacterium]|nr:beta-lactamase family protein [Verrucomicrobiota bacterium]
MSSLLPSDRWAALRAHFEENFTERGELGAAVSIWRDGEEVVSLAGGAKDRTPDSAPFTAATPVLFWSVTKALASACVLHVLQTDGIELETRVSALWPEFAQAGKEAITLAQVLSHQAGLAALDDPRAVDIRDHAAVARALAAQTPNWPPGSAHGYHPRTFGSLLDEILRRRRPGSTVGSYWRENFAEPLALDVYIGLPPEIADDAVAPIFTPRTPSPATGERPGDEADAFRAALAEEGSLTRRAFASPSGLHAVRDLNTPAARRAELPSLGGIGTAHGLAKFYALLAGDGTGEGRTFFQPDTLRAMRTTLANGPDRVLRLPTAFSAGFMQDPVDPQTGKKLRQLFGPSPRAFGQPGAGGAHAFADPDTGTAFAYVMNQMEPGLLPNEKSLGLVAAYYAAQAAAI